MLRVVLTRCTESDEGVFGYLDIYKDGARLYTCRTGELPYKDNKPNVSCIPVGTYKCEPWDSVKFPNTYHIKNVPDREAILIHTGNHCGDTSKGYKSDVEGCILVGERCGKLNNQKAVLSSKQAMQDIRVIIGRENFLLTIVEAPHARDD